MAPTARRRGGRSGGEDLSLPLPPAEGPGRRSAVLILFGEDANGPNVLITERAATLRSHAGQPSFPGGRIDPDDAGPVAAALREAVEETGLDPTGVDVFARAARRGHVAERLGGDAGARVVAPPESGPCGRPRPRWRRSMWSRSPTSSTRRTGCGSATRAGSSGRRSRSPGLLVWGFTATLLTEVLRLGGFDRPWDTDRVEPLPPDVVAITMRERAAAEAHERDRERDRDRDDG